MQPYYEQDGITIYHGDCREVLPSLAPVDLVLTDPPYEVISRPTNGLRSMDKAGADKGTCSITEWLPALCKLATGSLYVWCGTEQVSNIRREMVDAGLSTRLCIWEKSNPSPANGEHLWLSSVECCVFGRKAKATFNTFCASPVWRGPIDQRPDHPTPKPEWLFRVIMAASSNVGDRVLDPFMGSGTTLRAAKDLGRRCIGIELEERYCEIAAKRLQQSVLALDVA